jgi:hypothetical protein
MPGGSMAMIAGNRPALLSDPQASGRRFARAGTLLKSCPPFHQKPAAWRDPARLEAGGELLCSDIGKGARNISSSCIGSEMEDMVGCAALRRGDVGRRPAMCNGQAQDSSGFPGARALLADRNRIARIAVADIALLDLVTVACLKRPTRLSVTSAMRLMSKPTPRTGK